MVSAAFAGPQKPKKPPMAKPNAAAGMKVYKANGCAGCHKIKDQGGEAGPNLTAYAKDKTKDAKWTTIQIRTPPRAQSRHQDARLRER